MANDENREHITFVYHHDLRMELKIDGTQYICAIFFLLE